MSSTERAGVGLTETMARLRGLVSVAPRAGTLYVPVRCTDMTALLDALDADLADLAALRANANEVEGLLLEWWTAEAEADQALDDETCDDVAEQMTRMYSAQAALRAWFATREQQRRGGEGQP